MFDVIQVGPADRDLLSFLRAGAERSGLVAVKEIGDPRATIAYVSHLGHPTIYGRKEVLQALARMQPRTAVSEHTASVATPLLQAKAYDPPLTQSYQPQATAHNETTSQPYQAPLQAKAYNEPVSPSYYRPSGEVDLTPSQPRNNGPILLAGGALVLAWIAWGSSARKGAAPRMSRAEHRLMVARSNPVGRGSCEYCAGKPRKSGPPQICKSCTNDDPSTCMRCPPSYNWPVGTLLVDPETDDVCCPRHSHTRAR